MYVIIIKSQNMYRMNLIIYLLFLITSLSSSAASLSTTLHNQFIKIYLIIMTESHLKENGRKR